MSDYTPTTEQMRDLYVWADPAGYKSRKEYEAEFDRWLERTLQEARAEAWEEGHEAAAMRVPEGVWHDTASPRTPNPYRQEEK